MAAIEMGLAETLVPGSSSSGDGDAAAPVVRRRPGSIEAPGVLAGRYRVSRFVGAGAFGLVYEALDERLQKTVAVKLLGADRMRRGDALARFRAEALAASRLSHPYIVSVTDFDLLEDGRAFLVMEYVAGVTLADFLAQAGPLPVRTAVRIVHGLLGALAEAHAHGVVHRDLKPTNIIVADVDAPMMKLKILDFGVAKLAEGRSSPARSATGHLVGTPAYMAPEQIRADLYPLDGRADLYAAGMLLYEMLTGSVPFEGGSIAELLLAQLESPPRPPRALRPEIPRRLQAIILRALRKDPARRFSNADDMAAALAAVLGSPSGLPDRRGARLLAAAVAAATLAGACALFTLRPGDGTDAVAAPLSPDPAAPVAAPVAARPRWPAPSTAIPPALPAAPAAGPTGDARRSTGDRPVRRRPVSGHLPDSPLPL